MQAVGTHQNNEELNCSNQGEQQPEGSRSVGGGRRHHNRQRDQPRILITKTGPCVNPTQVEWAHPSGNGTSEAPLLAEKCAVRSNGTTRTT